MLGLDTPVVRRAAFAVADGITLLRIPLAIAFPFFTGTDARLALLGLAAATDFSDGIVARRFGGSRLGVLLDPVADKLFMAFAFGVVLFSGALSWYEIVAVLARDIVATIAFVITIITGRAASVPARVGGKAVTLMQFLTLVAFVMDWALLHRAAWATGAVAVYAVYDYNKPFFRKLRKS
jgi:cardiolipin synthase